MILANTDVYNGEFDNEIFNGLGVYTKINKLKYDGKWKNGSMNGNGIIYYPDGSKYEGNFLDTK